MQSIGNLDVNALPYLAAAWFGAQDKMGNSGGLGELGISPQSIRAESGIPTNDGGQALVDRPDPAIRKPFGKAVPGPVHGCQHLQPPLAEAAFH